MTIGAFEVMARPSTECEKILLMKKTREEEEEGGDKGKTSLEHYSVRWECNFLILNAKAEL